MINYYLLTKPGIVMGNILTFAAGFLLASQGSFQTGLFFATLLGLAAVMASACVLNNTIDRPLDRKMARTRNRPSARGLISGPQALVFAGVLGFFGIAVLCVATNLLTVLVTTLGFFVYVVLYSLWKSRTVYSTAIGSIAGAIPPVVGYCAAGNRLDIGAFILFAMLVLWQMPHFFAIAMMHLDDYTAAKIPVLPVVKGPLRAKMHMLVYIVGFIGSAVLLTVFHYTGWVYLIVTTLVSAVWFCLGLKGFKTSNDQRWGQQMFRFSLVLITAVCVLISMDQP